MSDFLVCWSVPSVDLFAPRHLQGTAVRLSGVEQLACLTISRECLGPLGLRSGSTCGLCEMGKLSGFRAALETQVLPLLCFNRPGNLLWPWLSPNCPARPCSCFALVPTPQSSVAILSMRRRARALTLCGPDRLFALARAQLCLLSGVLGGVCLQDHVCWRRRPGWSIVSSRRRGVVSFLDHENKQRALCRSTTIECPLIVWRKPRELWAQVSAFCCCSPL